ncbi:MAG: phage adaptor protein [Nitrososphaera sp.]
MATYADIKSRIEAELNRSDLSSEVSLAVQSAVDYYSGRRFYFNERRAVTTATPGTGEYPVPPNFIAPDNLRMRLEGNTYDESLSYVSWEDVDERYGFTGRPILYTYYQEAIHVWPIPNATAIFTLSFIARLPELSANTVSNAWTNGVGGELVRSRACRDVSLRILHDNNLGEIFGREEALIVNRLDSELSMRVARGKTVKRGW